MNYYIICLKNPLTESASGSLIFTFVNAIRVHYNFTI